MKKYVILASVLATTAVANADTLQLGTTTGGRAVGAMFDLTNSGSAALQIDSFDFLTTFVSSASAPWTYEIAVYYVAGGHTGHEGSSNFGDWTLMGTDSVTVSPPAGTIGNAAVGGLVMNPGETYGIAFITTNGTSYGGLGLETPGGVGHTLSDGTLTAVTGNVVTSTSLDIVTNPSFNQKDDILAGNVNYTVVPAPGAMALLGLGGLAAVRRRR